jgi:sporulation protein YlmC with PRC-barrel domain
MPTEFTMGARASCTDGFCGVVSRTILDPAAETITHLVIEPRHRRESGRLVPVELVDEMAGEVRLRCTLAEFGGLDPAEEIEPAGGEYDGGQAATVPGFSMAGEGMPSPASTGLGLHTPMLVSHMVPVGESEVQRHEHVHATDGWIGQVEGFVIDPANHTVTHVLLKEGHPWGRKQVAIPVSAIASVTDGIKLTISKKEVEDLPPASVDQT